MPRTNPILTDRADAMRRAALLYSQGMKQDAIHTRLGIAQSVVSELISDAKKEGVLDCSPRLNLPEEEQAKILEKVYLQDLNLRLQDYAKSHDLKNVPNVHVCYSSSELDRKTLDPPNVWDDAVLKWGGQVAPYVRNLLRGCDRIGITWGRQCRSVVDGIQKLHKESFDKPIEVIPVWCPRLTDQPEEDDRVFPDQLKLSSNSLAYDLCVAMNGSQYKNSHAMLPGFDLIPFEGIKDFNRDLKTPEQRQEDKENLARIVKIYDACPAYHRIFGKRSSESTTNAGLIWKVNAIVTSVGPAGTSRAFGRGNESYGGVPQDFFKEHTIGDVGGVLLPRGEASEKSTTGRKFIRLRERWMGINENHFRNCAEQNNPGVIVLAVGTTRAEVVLKGLIDRQLANHLIIDQACARALEQLL